MYCQACGIALTHQMRYCNRCGAQIVALTHYSSEKTPQEKRLDDYLDGMFWITVFGMGFVLGGLVVLKKLDLSNWLIFSYMVVSSIAFLLNFGLSMREVVRINRQRRDQNALSAPANTAELAPDEALPLPPVSSVTENTTRTLEPIYSERKPE